MKNEEILAEWNRLLEVTPVKRDDVTIEAKNKATALFAKLLPVFKETDDQSANMLLNHMDTVITTMAQAYQTILNGEKEYD